VEAQVLCLVIFLTLLFNIHFLLWVTFAAYADLTFLASFSVLTLNPFNADDSLILLTMPDNFYKYDRFLDPLPMSPTYLVK